ncbi:hypothetical protein GCM10011504_19940 [Siccirubricoccus deserti]|nr:hypothetical protein GCM10011504_19940 [Siccirubricoccus deserti]
MQQGVADSAGWRRALLRQQATLQSDPAGAKPGDGLGERHGGMAGSAGRRGAERIQQPSLGLRWRLAWHGG